MAMSVGGAGGEEKPMSDINTTPLVDVMLVLLIIFLIAIPVVIQTVDDLEIPVVEFEPTETKNENILLSVSSTDANGLSPGDEGFAGASPNGECRVYVNVTPVDNAELQELAVKRLQRPRGVAACAPWPPRGPGRGPAPPGSDSEGGCHRSRR